jgi:hypothetical protein
VPTAQWSEDQTTLGTYLAGVHDQRADPVILWTKLKCRFADSVLSTMSATGPLSSAGPVKRGSKVSPLSLVMSLVDKREFGCRDEEERMALQGKRVLVIGGTQFMGRHLVERLLLLRCEVVASFPFIPWCCP